MDLFLVRHAQASFGEAEYDRLSPLGEIQAQRLGAWMARQGFRPELVARGTLRRHAQTVEHCMGVTGVDAQVVVASGLDEFDSDDLIARHSPALASRDALLNELAKADHPNRAFQALLTAAIARWIAGCHDHEYRTAWPVFQSRVLDAFNALTRHAAREIWLFTSGGPVGVIVGSLLGVSAERCFDLCWPLVNTSVTRIRVGLNTRQLVSYNAWSHLEAHSDKERLVTFR